MLHQPPYSPELNPVENIWQFLRQNHLSNRVFDSYDTILTACCEAWQALYGQARPHPLPSQPKPGHRSANVTVSIHLLIRTYLAILVIIMHSDGFNGHELATGCLNMKPLCQLLLHDAVVVLQ